MPNFHRPMLHRYLGNPAYILQQTYYAFKQSYYIATLTTDKIHTLIGQIGAMVQGQPITIEPPINVIRSYGYGVAYFGYQRMLTRCFDQPISAECFYPIKVHMFCAIPTIVGLGALIYKIFEIKRWMDDAAMDLAICKNHTQALEQRIENSINIKLELKDPRTDDYTAALHTSLKCLHTYILIQKDVTRCENTIQILAPHNELHIEGETEADKCLNNFRLPCITTVNSYKATITACVRSPQLGYYGNHILKNPCSNSLNEAAHNFIKALKETSWETEPLVPKLADPTNFKGFYSFIGVESAYRLSQTVAAPDMQCFVIDTQKKVTELCASHTICTRWYDGLSRQHELGVYALYSHGMCPDSWIPQCPFLNVVLYPPKQLILCNTSELYS